MLGALTLELLFALMNFYGVSGALRSTVQGAIILLAVAVSATRTVFEIKGKHSATSDSGNGRRRSARPRRLRHRRAGRQPVGQRLGRAGRAPASSRSSSYRPTTTPSSRCSRPPRPGPADKPWEQVLNPTMVDTAKFKKAGPYKICFSNAALNNPWRQVGFKTMQAEVEAQASRIKRVRARRRRGQGPEADRGHQRPARQGLRRADRLAEHHRHAHPGRRGGLQGGAAGHRLRPWGQHEVPGDVHQPHRRVRRSATSAPSSSARR